MRLGGKAVLFPTNRDLSKSWSGLPEQVVSEGCALSVYTFCSEMSSIVNSHCLTFFKSLSMKEFRAAKTLEDC